MTPASASACSGKRRFDSFNRAQGEANRVKRRRHTREKVYHCPHCGGFHIGNPAFGSIKRKARARVGDPE